ncbi:DUF7282 domain-containing protein [Halogranum rubrum]|uniref:DUF7282 domain-containing protein n=1 Tax=Halogranum rubrum TaxID=553466 RepID=UPI0012FCC6BE|nr:hypothetical protein [Halogranum salarium]
MPQSSAEDGPSRRSALKLVGSGLAAVAAGSSVGLAERGSSSKAADAATERSPNSNAAPQATAAVEEQVETIGVSIESQSPHHGTVYVEEVTVPESGFVAIHDASFFLEGQILGVSAPLAAGTYQNLPVVLDEMPDEPLTVSAIPHRDTPSDGTFTHPEDGDNPFIGEDGVVHDTATLQPE